MGNALRTTALLAALTGLLVWVGGKFGGSQGMVLAFALAVGTNFFGYWFSDKVVLASYGAQPVGPDEAPALHRIADRLRDRVGLPVTPALYVIPSDSLNAFATGRGPRHAAVAVTRGILRLLDERELEGVLAHELGHVRNRDILTGTIAATLAGAVMMLASMARWGLILGGGSRDREEGSGPELLLMVILAPLAATLIQLAISRGREYAADAEGARATGDPLALASALAKLEDAHARRPLGASPATAHMFIVNPLAGVSFARLFATHPPTEERIRRLRELAGAAR